MKGKNMLNQFIVSLLICLCLTVSVQAQTPVTEKVGILVTDWGTPDGMSWNYYGKIGHRSRIGDNATYDGEPCTENFMGEFPYTSQFGVLPYMIGFNMVGTAYQSAYDSYGIYRLEEDGDTLTNMVEPTNTVSLSSLVPPIIAEPAKNITFARGRAIFVPDTRDGTDHLDGLYIVGEPYLHPATGKIHFQGFPNNVHDALEIDLAYWVRVVKMMAIPEYADGPRMHPFTQQIEEDLTHYFDIYFGEKVDVRFGMYEETEGLPTQRHEDVALDFASEGFTKLLLTRETSDNNNYANMFMTRSHVDLALCRNGLDEQAEIKQVKQVGRTPEYNEMVLMNLIPHLERLAPGDDPVALCYVTYGNPWPGTSANPNTPFGVSHPWITDVYPENAYYNYLNFKRYAEDQLGNTYNLIYNRPGTSGDIRLDNYYAYGMFQPEYYTIPGETESTFKNIRETIDRMKQDGQKEAVVLLSHWYYDSIDNGHAIRDVNQLPMNSFEDLENDKFWLDWCENPESGDNTWTEISPEGYTCSDPNDIHILLTQTFDDVSTEFINGYAQRIRGGVERYGVFPNLGITIEAQGSVSMLTGGSAEITNGPRTGAKIVVPADPDPNAPEGYYPTETNPIVYETINDPEDPKIGAWFDFTAYVGEQTDVEPGISLPDMASAVEIGPKVFFGPYRSLFNKPARITLPYNPALVTEPASIRPYIFNDLTRMWDSVYPVSAGEGLSVNTTLKTVSFDVQTLGIFVLAVNPPCNDIDLDGICEDTDNCPDAANPNQEDADGDGTGDVCDADTISGTVTGAVQGGVTIELYTTSCGANVLEGSTTTNSEGYYSFGGLEDGRYLLFASAVGYCFIPVSGWVDIPQGPIQFYDFTATANPVP